MDQTPNIFPTMRFADADLATEWLKRVFGFAERAVHRAGDGTVAHAELSLGAGMIMFGQGDPAVHGVYVAVEEIDDHYAQAVAGGAEITRELGDTEYGSREYAARDLEGHAWTFGTYQPAPAV